METVIKFQNKKFLLEILKDKVSPLETIYYMVFNETILEESKDIEYLQAKFFAFIEVSNFKLINFSHE